jgi:hypothetical protein
VSCTDTGPSGLNRNALIGELSDDEMRQLCSWVIGEQGGEGAVFECGAFQVTNDTVEQCVRERGELDPCFLSVAHVEDCIVAAGPNPCAIVSTPECDPYLSCITR